MAVFSLVDQFKMIENVKENLNLYYKTYFIWLSHKKELLIHYFIL